MSPIFKCLICRKDIERSTKTFWKKKGHLLCSTCLDNIEKNTKKKNLQQHQGSFTEKFSLRVKRSNKIIRV